MVPGPRSFAPGFTLLWMFGLVVGNWPLLRAMGWALFSRLYSPEMQDIDGFLTQVPNAQGGSQHVAQGAVRIDGAGVWCGGAFRADNAAITIAAQINRASTTAVTAGQVRTSAGNLYVAIVGGTTGGAGAAPAGTGMGQIDGGVTWNYVSPAGNFLTVHGTASIASDGLFELQAGNLSYIRPGATLIVQGSAGPVSGAITLTAFGLINVQAGSRVIVNGTGAFDQGQVYFGTWGNLYLDAGATADLVGVTIVHAGAPINLFGGIFVQPDGGISLIGSSSGHLASEIFGAWSTLSMTSNATLSAGGSTTVTLAGANTLSGTNFLTGTNVLSGPNTLSGATSQTAPYTRSGNTGYTVNRQLTAANNVGIALPLTIDGTQYDYVATNVVGGGVGALTLSAPPHVEGIFLWVAAPLHTSGTITVVDGVTSTVIADLGAGLGGGTTFTTQAGFALLKTGFDGANWRWFCPFSFKGS